MQRLSDIQAFKDRSLIVRGADIATQRGWTGVPNFILESKELSLGAKLTYAMLLKYAREDDECFPGQDRLGDDIGTSRQSVNTYIKELRDASLVTIRRRGQGRSNIYIVHVKASFWGRNGK